MSLIVNYLMPVREADARVCGGVVSLIAHLRCDGDLQRVGTRNRLSYIGLRHFVARPMHRERVSADAVMLLMDESQMRQPCSFAGERGVESE